MKIFNTEKNSSHNGIIMIALAALCWSCGGIFLKMVNAGIGVISFWRYLAGLIALILLNRSFPVFLIKNENKSINKKDTFLLWIGGISFSICAFLYVCANRYTTAANAILLQYSNPIWIIIFGPFLLKEKNRVIDFITIGGVLFGMVLFFASELKNINSINKTMMFGNLCAIVSGFFLALYTMIMRLQKSGNTVESSMLSQVIGVVVCFPFILQTSSTSFKSMVFIILAGFVNGALALFFYSRGMKKTPALTASLICMLEPITNPIWVFLFSGEKPSFICITGGIVILGFVITRIIVCSKKPIP